MIKTSELNLLFIFLIFYTFYIILQGGKLRRLMPQKF